MSTKYPSDGLTDEQLATFEASDLGRINAAADRGDIKGIGILEDYTRYEQDEEEGQPRKPLPLLPVKLDFSNWGGITKPLYANLGGEVTVRNTEEHEVEALRRPQFAFEGNYQTFLRGNDLVIPPRYDGLLKFGGVVAPGIDKHLTVFGGRHWDRMLTLLGKHVGIDPNKNTLVRHILGRATRFERLNVDGTITLTDELINYAGLKKNGSVAWVGMIYHAELHDNENDAFKDDNYLTSEDIGRIFNLAR